MEAQRAKLLKISIGSFNELFGICFLEMNKYALHISQTIFSEVNASTGNELI